MDTFAFWGKADEAGHWHPAVCHVLDVGRVAEALFMTVLPMSVVEMLSYPVGEDPGRARPWLAFLCALHDLGKISPGFQKKRRDLFAAPGEGFTFSSADESDHGAVTAEALAGLLRGFGLGFEAAEDIARALGGHHGSFPSLMSKSITKGAWDAARREVVSALAEASGVHPEGASL
jgi:CRISPR-associated endonuclease/helicase Cas3